MDDPDFDSLRARLEDLKLEHRDLDKVIETLQAHSDSDQLQLNRLKRRKLAIKDEISEIEDRLLPDIIA